MLLIVKYILRVNDKQTLIGYVLHFVYLKVASLPLSIPAGQVFCNFGNKRSILEM